jgi:nucleotide-binding universal stress UspA family protein
MVGMSPDPTRAPRARPTPGDGPAPFADVLCALDGSRGSKEAVKQAIALAAPGAELLFIAVSQARGVGLTEVAALGESRAREALEEAARKARARGVSASVELRKSGATSEVLLSEAERHDLLVLGSRGVSRAGGIMLGSTATQAAHRTSGPLLLARPGPKECKFPDRILLATDGSPGSWAAARAASRIARTFSSAIEVVHVPRDTDPERRRALGEQMDAIREQSGVEPLLTDATGRVAEAIVDAARADRSTLVAIGHRGVRGIRALGSVSERVVHESPCSVLVVPPDD